MAKFAVGEIAVYSARGDHAHGKIQLGEIVKIISMDCLATGDDGVDRKRDYRIDYKGYKAGVQEWQLRKLPPDEKDATEDPGLTLIKKLLEQDTKKEKEHA